MPKQTDSRSGNPAKKAAAKKATVADIREGRKVHRIRPKGEVVYFDFQLPDDDTIHRVPYMQYLTIEQVSVLENDDSLAGVLEIFGADEDTIEAIKTLDGEQLNDLMNAWRSASELGLGE